MDSNNTEEYNKIVDTWEKLDDSLKSESIELLYEIFEKSSKKDGNGKYVIDIHNFYYNIWKKQSPEIQKEAYTEIINRVKNHILHGDIMLQYYQFDQRMVLAGIMGNTSGSALSDIFHNQPEEIKTEIFNTLKLIMPTDKYPANKDEKRIFDTLMRRIWMDASVETQVRNSEMLNCILNLAKDEYEETVAYLNKLQLKNSKYRTPESLEIIKKTIEGKEKEKNNNNLELLKNTKCKFSKEQFQAFIDYNNKINQHIYSNYNIDALYELYEQIYEYNTNISLTVNIDTLAVFGNEIDIMKLVRISTLNNSLQESLVKLIISNEVIKQIIFTSMNSSEYWDTEITAIHENSYSFNELFKNINVQNVEFSKEDIEKLKNIILQKNYFNIQSIEDIQDYDKIKSEICQRILNGEELSNQYEYINAMTKEERKKFAILEMQYGISLEDAINIVQKYGMDIEQIEDDEYSDVIEQVRNLKRILNTDNIAKLYEENNIEEILGKVTYIPTTLDNECLNLYAKLYQKDFEKYSINKNIKSISKVKYNGKDIRVVKVSPYMMVNEKKRRGEISAFARVEGAFAEWTEPENFRDALEIASVGYHGNCKSHIRSNNMGICKPKGPIYLYETCPRNTLKLMAPWDIDSDFGSASLAINSLKWNKDISGALSEKRIAGVQFRSPIQNTNNTRGGYSEAVSERLIPDGNRFTKDELDLLLYITESGETIEDYEELLETKDFNERLKTVAQKEDDLTDEEYKILNADRWRMSKKAAMQFQKDIIIMDRDEWRECEETRLTQLLELFEDSNKEIDFIEESDKQLSKTELLEKIIVEFENNVAGSVLARNKGLFDDKNREEIFNRIQNKIDSLRKSNPTLHNILSQELERICEVEFNKIYSNNEKQVALPEFKSFYEEKVVNLKLSREYATGEEIKTLDFNEQGVQYSSKIKVAIEEINKTDLYEGNNQYSIEHINKVILFAGLIAKNEGLDEQTTNILIAASAFLDSGIKALRDEMKGENKSHSEKSAEIIMEYLEANPENPFGITNENIGILQAAIDYHEHIELEIGKMDEDTVERLCDKYEVKNEDFETVLQISEFLKDADTLDRIISFMDEKQDSRYLKSNTARKGSMITYVKKVNEELAKEKLVEEYGLSEEELETVDPINELNKRELKNKAYGNKKLGMHISSSKMIEIIQKAKVNYRDIEDISISKNKMLMNLYKTFNVDKSAILQAKKILKDTLYKLKTIFKERS